MIKAAVSVTIEGFDCVLEFEAEKLAEVLAQIRALSQHGVHAATGDRVQPLLPLEPGQYRALVTQIKRDGDVVRLWFRGCKFESAKIFNLSDLDVVGIDYQSLVNDVETPVRFFAVYELSEKLNSKNNPYKDIVWLESANGYDVRTDPLGNVLETRSALGHDITNEEAAPVADGDSETSPPAAEPSDLDGYFPRAKAPAVDATEFYKRLGELKTTKKVGFDVDKRNPLDAAIASAKQTGDWAAALKVLNAQVRM